MGRRPIQRRHAEVGSAPADAAAERAWALGLLACVAWACSTDTQGLGPGSGDAGVADVNASDAGDAADADGGGGTSDGGDADADAPPAPGARRFEGRVGSIRAGDGRTYLPTDLAGWRFRARSGLGESPVRIDGPGRFSVWATGRLELLLEPAGEADARLLVSTEAERLDYTLSSRERPDDPPLPRTVLLDVELTAPWTETDQLVVWSSSGWRADVFPPAEAVGRTRLTGLPLEVGGVPRLVGEDLWVGRQARPDRPTATRQLTELTLVRGLTAEALRAGLGVRLAPRGAETPAVQWDLRGWEADAWSRDPSSFATRAFVRSDRLSSISLAGLLGGDATAVLDFFETAGPRLVGELPATSAVPDGYVACVRASRIARASYVDLQVPNGSFDLAVQTVAQDCRPGPDMLRSSLGPVRAIELDGSALGAQPRSARAPFRLSWAAPGVGSPNGYLVTLRWASGALVVMSDRPEVTVPAGILPEGAQVGVMVSAIEDRDLPPVISPFVRSLTWRQTDWATGPVVSLR